MVVSSSQLFRFGNGYELDLAAYQLRRSGRALKLPRIPMEVLRLLIEERGKLVTREQIIERIWGREIFVDTDNSINAAIRTIRRVLGDDSEEPRFIQTIIGRGYRFIAAVSEIESPPLTVPARTQLFDVPPTSNLPPPNSVHLTAASERTEPQSRKPTLNLRLWVVLAGCTLLVLIVAELYRARHHAQSISAPAARRVMLAVLPFENLTGDAGQEYFSDGMTEKMITEVGRLDPEHLGVIARTSVMLYKHTPKPVEQIGRELGVQYVIEGSVRRDSSNIRITAQLIQVKDQTHIWANQYDREQKNLLLVQAEIAQEIAERVRLILGDRPQLRVRSRPNVPTTDAAYESYDLYLKGLYYWNKRREGFDQAATYFQQAVAKDPNNARAYAGLANTFALMSTYYIVPHQEYVPKARAAALKALELDDDLAEAHTSLALLLESYDYDWNASEQEFRKAIDLNPDYATAHQWYAEHLAWRGRFEEAFSESERARQLDPISVIIAADHCQILFFSRQYDRALEHCRAVFEMDPRANMASGLIFSSLVEQRKFAEAERLISPDQSPMSIAWPLAMKAYLYGRWGRSEQARAFLEKQEQDRANLGYNQMPVLLLAYSGAGTADEVLTLLQKAYEEHSNALTTLKVDPKYDRFRSDPRFRELLHRVGLDQ